MAYPFDHLQASKGIYGISYIVPFVHPAFSYDRCPIIQAYVHPQNFRLDLRSRHCSGNAAEARIRGPGAQTIGDEHTNASAD